MTRLHYCFVYLVLLCLSSVVGAHENRPLYVDIVEEQPLTYRVQVKVPPTVDGRNRPQIKLPETCVLQGAQLYLCESSVNGQIVSVEYPAYNPSVSSFLRLKLSNGEEYTALLAATQNDWLVPTEESASGVAKHYTWLGVEHILIGLDHLLFVACLMFVAGTFRRMIITATGFTLAHSVTLALSALELVRFPVAPVETLIAFSILFLAVEIARGNRQTLTYRRPVLVSTSFGLLHGFGFASVLQDIGLPQTEVVTGLLFFNVGVEIGQVLFIAVGAAIVYGLKRITSDTVQSMAQTLAIYVIGILASYWMYDRALGVL